MAQQTSKQPSVIPVSKSQQPEKDNAPVTASVTPRLLTIKQAATYLACSVWHIRELIWSKELHALRFGRRYVIDRAELDSFVDTQLTFVQ